MAGTMTDFLERSKYTRALIKAGVRPTGWSTERLKAEYEALGGAAFSSEPAPALQPAPAKVAKVASIKAAPAPNDAAQALEVLKNALNNAGGINECRVIELIKQHSAAPKVLEVRNIDAGTVEVIPTPHYAFNSVLSALRVGLNAYLYGPAGTGKTTLAQQCAQALGLDFYFTGAILQKYELTGFIDAGGEYQSTPFRQAFEHGGVFLFDEMDASSAQALIAFNAAIANGVCAFPDKTVTKNAAFRVVAASNTQGNGATGDYVRNKLDRATLDRYVFIDIGYDKQLEIQLATATGEAYGLADEIAPLIALQVQQMRDKAANVGALITPRATDSIIKLLAAGLSQSQAFELAIFNKLSADQRAQLER
jgi:hypothetical protein